MTNSAMQCLQLIVNSMWKLFTAWRLPGLGFTPAQFVMFLILFPLILDFVSSIFGGVTSALPGRINSANRESRRHGDKG